MGRSIPGFTADFALNMGTTFVHMALPTYRPGKAQGDNCKTCECSWQQGAVKLTKSFQACCRKGCTITCDCAREDAYGWSCTNCPPKSYGTYIA